MSRRRFARTLMGVLLGTLATVLTGESVSGQILRPRYDWPYYRQLHDEMGQSYSDYGPGGWGYYTPPVLPGIDDFNGPSRAYSPIFNAPQAAPRGSLMRPENLYPPPIPRTARAGARAGLLRRVLGRR